MRLAEPKRVLAALLKKKGMEAPVARWVALFSPDIFPITQSSRWHRLLEESGRMTHAPSFVVGIFSGATKLGEGVGNSLKMAETRVSFVVPPSTPSNG
jgi:large subunit ribosomal protein L44